MGARTSSHAPYGLLGRTLGHSWSPQIHRLLGSVPYDLFEVEPEDVRSFIREGSWRGINVTIPYKRDAADAADELSANAARLGVANTLVRRRDGSIFADNTDLAGFAWMMDRFCQRELGGCASEILGGRKVLVLGSGGASQAVQAALEDVGARTVVISRKGPETYEGLDLRHADARLIVNTTPVGMYPHCPASPLADETLRSLPQLAGVLDVVYNPERTGLVLAAERCGIPAQSGLAMLVAQARFSSELFQGRALDDDLVEQIEARLAAQSRNICLIGMPGVGKTSTARALGRTLKRPFIDLDDAFEVRFGMTAADFIRSRGEEDFRVGESQVLADYGARSGLIIACGGGVVTRPDNYDLLHQNGTLILLERDLSLLSDKDRPLSQKRGVAELARERGPLYHAWADLTLRCTGSAAGDAEAIISALGLVGA